MAKLFSKLILKHNLISVGKLNEKGYNVHFDNNKVYIEKMTALLLKVQKKMNSSF
jgi:hypothetical protein